MVDRFQLLPQEIIQHILCLLLIQEAARTSVLSSQWVHHWTKIPVLVFDEETFQVAGDDELTDLEETYGNIESDRRLMTHRSRFFSAIYQTFLKHDAVMLEFTLRVNSDVTCVEIDHILSYLAKKNTLEKLTLDMTYKLPSTIFLLEKLIHLHLSRCELTRRPRFNGFLRLTNLRVENVTTTTSSIVHLLSGCPHLKILNLNLDAENFIADDDSSIQDLFDCLAGIESLSVSFSTIHTFAVGRAIPLPVSLPLLTYIYIDEMSFTTILGLPLLLFLIRSSPNLEKLRLLMSSAPVNVDNPVDDLVGDPVDDPDDDPVDDPDDDPDDDPVDDPDNDPVDDPDDDPVDDLVDDPVDDLVDDPVDDPAHVDGYDIQLARLHSFEMECVMDVDAEMDFVQIVMASSPVLEHVRISVYLEDDLLRVQETLLACEHAPPDLTVGIFEE